MTPIAYSTGSGYSDYHDDDDHSKEIPKSLCKDSNNLIVNGCFEKPIVPSNGNKYWNIYDKITTPDLAWDVAWLVDADNSGTINPCLTGEPGFTSSGLLELQRGILGGPAEGYQHAELDSDCNGPVNNARSGEPSSVAISQTITTSENNDYKITFAYKARPDQPLSTNGLMVTWNDATIANNFEFSKKDWKYASIIVHGTTGQTKLSFEDTGNPDSLGTFLDDVSVIPIPKPMSSITLKKAITNDNSGTAIPTDFAFKIKNVEVPHTEIAIQHNVKTNVPAGTYTMSESGPAPEKGSYSFVLIAGDDSCPTMLQDMDQFTLKKGEDTTCVIYNDDNADGQSPTVDPPTIKIINNVGNPTTDPYSITVLPTVLPTSNPPTISGGMTEYTVGSHTKVTISGPIGDDRPILITGDGNCPENIDGFVNIENGQHITCTYGDRPVIQPSGGIIFQHNSMKVQLGDITAFDSCDKTENPAEKDPCIEIINAESGIIGIVDSALTSDNTIVLFSVIEADRLGPTITGAINPVCSISAIAQHDKESFYLRDADDPLYPSHPTENNVVVLKCVGMIIEGQDPDFPDDPSKTYTPVYNVNYVMIDPTA